MGIGFLLNYVPKRLGYPKFGKALTIAFGIFILIVLVMLVFEDAMFTKKKAKRLIEEQDIELIDDFSIKNNESSWSIGDYYHTFTLEISEADKVRAINEIRVSEEFKSIGDSIVDLYWDTEDVDNGPKQIQNFETENAYIREYLSPNGDKYAPTYRRIKVFKNRNELVFEDIDY